MLSRATAPRERPPGRPASAHLPCRCSRGELLLVAGDAPGPADRPGADPERPDEALRRQCSSGTATPGSSACGRRAPWWTPPGVNEPEQHLSVRDLVTEDLALVPRRYRGALLSKPWLKVNRFEDIAGLWTEELPARPARRTAHRTGLGEPAHGSAGGRLPGPAQRRSRRLAAPAAGTGVRRRTAARRRRHGRSAPGRLDRTLRRHRERR